MKHKKLVFGAFVVVLALVMASPAWAAITANWQMNETSGVMRDSSGQGNDGSPTNVKRTGSVYIFNGTNSRVAVPDSPSLDPGTASITMTARVKVSGSSLDDDSYDIVRKGLSTTSGGDYKLEIKRASDSTVGQLNCVFNGTNGTVNRKAPPDVVDGSWHTLSCTKTDSSVVAEVDGQTYSKSRSAGAISNSTEVLIGAKTTSPLDDVFAGSIDYASINIG